jgi:hypothetical protein
MNTWLQEQERAAMLGERAAVLHVVSALRTYRAAFERLAASRYSDGAADGAAVAAAMASVSEVEDPGESEQ